MNKPFETVLTDLEEKLKVYLDRSGMYYRIFSRAKTIDSLQKKLKNNPNKYQPNGKKIQDLIGIRIVFYFQEDVAIFHDKLKNIEGYDPANESNSSKDLDDLTAWISSWKEERKEDKQRLGKLLPFRETVFMPERLNIVMKLGKTESEWVKDELNLYLGQDAHLVDDTYEIQLRTVLSEGWHEVEHDLRYKTHSEEWWNYCNEESRMLNGIYASLETNERALAQMIDGLAYKTFKNGNWDAMIRSHFRRRISEMKLPKEICTILDADDRIAKQLLHVSRQELTNWLWKIEAPFILSSTLIVHIINRQILKNESIAKLESEPIKSLLDSTL